MTATAVVEAPTRGAAADPPDAMSSRTFARGLTVIALAGLAIRIGTAFFYDARTRTGGDAVWFTGTAKTFSEGKGFVDPLLLVLGHSNPTAAHPPLYSLYLSVVNFTFGDSVLLHRLWSCLPGVATVVLLGLIGREIAGRRTGLIAAALAAISIELFVQDVMLWSEGMYGFTLALTIFFAYRYLKRPNFLHVALLSGAIALAALTRAEAVLLFVILLVPLVLRNREQPMGDRIKAVGVGAVVAIVLMAPWVIYNNSGRFNRPVAVTVTFGTLIGSSNCHAAYYGPTIGGWGGLCLDTVPNPWPRDETDAEAAARTAGFKYMGEHADRLPVVIPARLGRTFGLFQPTKSISNDLLFEEAHISRLAYAALAQYWLYLGLGIAGCVVLYRRRVALLPFLAPAATVVVITVIGYGGMRFRFAIDVIIPVLAAVTIDHLLTRRAARRGSPAPPGTVASNS
jgi:4-amino-4-deoxy-L-arabinose transferase-like glycosyltransferase